MNLEITDKNLYLLLPGKISRVACFYADEHKVTILDALRMFYHSDTYRRLSDETTKLWHDGPVALYQEFIDELKQDANKINTEIIDSSAATQAVSCREDV